MSVYAGGTVGLVKQLMNSFVQVISAHNLPKPMGSGAKGEVIDPYVVLELHGVPADCTDFRTRTAAQNQSSPIYDETFEFQVSSVHPFFVFFVLL